MSVLDILLGKPIATSDERSEQVRHRRGSHFHDRATGSRHRLKLSQSDGQIRFP